MNERAFPVVLVDLVVLFALGALFVMTVGRAQFNLTECKHPVVDRAVRLPDGKATFTFKCEKSAR